MANPDNDFPTTIGPDAFFKGHLKFEKGARLLGRFEGEISSTGELVVAQGARINADVKVDSIRIDGELKGNLNVAAKVQLSSSGRVEGDIQASRLEVAEGAVLIGQIIATHRFLRSAALFSIYCRLAQNTDFAR